MSEGADSGFLGGLLQHDSVKGVVALVEANKPAAAAAAAAVVLTTGCLCLRGGGAPAEEPVEEEEEVVPKSDPVEEDEEEQAEIVGTVELTAVEYSMKDHPVVLEEVVDAKGRRLIVASEHNEVPLGVKVDSLNGDLIHTCDEARRAVARLPVAASHTLTLGSVTLTLEPVEPSDDYEKKASPILMKPEERKDMFKTLKHEDEVAVTVSPPAEGLEPVGVPPVTISGIDAADDSAPAPTPPTPPAHDEEAVEKEEEHHATPPRAVPHKVTKASPTDKKPVKKVVKRVVKKTK